jgi:hypothetical protein
MSIRCRVSVETFRWCDWLPGFKCCITCSSWAGIYPTWYLQNHRSLTDGFSRASLERTVDFSTSTSDPLTPFQTVWEHHCHQNTCQTGRGWFSYLPPEPYDSAWVSLHRNEAFHYSTIFYLINATLLEAKYFLSDIQLNIPLPKRIVTKHEAIAVTPYNCIRMVLSSNLDRITGVQEFSYQSINLTSSW